jgi:hypothetical protein
MPSAAIEELATIQMLAVHMPSTGGREITLGVYP